MGLQFQPHPKNVIPLANRGGRLGWKIDAKRAGFNVQKHGGYALEHAYTQNPAAAKIFYFLLPIAQLLSQLMVHGSLAQHLPPPARHRRFAAGMAWRAVPELRSALFAYPFFIR